MDLQSSKKRNQRKNGGEMKKSFGRHSGDFIINQLGKENFSSLSPTPLFVQMICLQRCNHLCL